MLRPDDASDEHGMEPLSRNAALLDKGSLTMSGEDQIDGIS